MTGGAQTVQRIPCYEPGSGHPESDAALERVSRMFDGYVPNFHRVMAQSPAVIDAFEKMRASLQRTSLRPLERELISLEVSRRNGCEYCLAAHSMFARRLRLPEDQLEAALDGRPLADARLALVRRAARELIDTQGRLSDDALTGYRQAGLGDAQILEVIAVIGWYTWATLTNNLARTVVDLKS